MTKVSYMTVYLYANLNPTTEDKYDPTPNLRCIGCGKLLARTNGKILQLANTQAPTIDEVPANVPAFEIKCPGCNKVMHVIWQSL
jgi:phage FluMu protein Com